MNSELTVRIRSIVVALCVAVGLLVAYLLGNAGAQPPPASAAPVAPDHPEEARSIVMRGGGDATGVPDQVSFMLAVRTKADDVTAALDQGNASMRRVQRSLLDAGVLRKDIQTAGLNIHADYDYPQGGPPVITGYVVSQEVGVLVRSLRDSGAALSAAIESGGNTVRLHGLKLRVGDEQSLMREARDAAVAEATAKADQYAEATGQQLGNVVSIREVSSARPEPVPVYSQRAALDTLSAGKVPIRAGSSEMNVTVKVEWTIA